MTIHTLDRFYLSLTLLVTIAYQLLGFKIAWTFQFDKITDLTGGTNFLFLALLTLLMGQSYHARNIITSILVMVWAIRIAAFLFYRVLKAGSDSRFDSIRSHFFKFLGFWIAQILWVWIVSLPLVILNSPAVSDIDAGGSNPSFGTSRDIAGIVLWTLGFVIETIADLQKLRYKFSQSPNKNKLNNRGLWAWSRHPPYFGEMMCWWGIWILCLSPTTNGSLSSSAKAAQYGAIMSPIFTVLLLMFGSGIPTAEKPQAKKYYLMSHGPDAHDENAWFMYKEYLNRTSILVPFPPALYRHLPNSLKRSIFLDFPMYGFTEERDGPPALEEAKNTKP